MEQIKLIQKLQLELLESALTNENCATDLVSVLNRLTNKDCEAVIEVINLLLTEADRLKTLSKAVTSNRYFIFRY
ncbi:TPA: hypothetical protein NIC52_005922 [Pseudomonas aeruginosa]|nr:hypothetical protein [Pseudomonas aeruginosa]